LHELLDAEVKREAAEDSKNCSRRSQKRGRRGQQELLDAEDAEVKREPQRIGFGVSTGIPPLSLYCCPLIL
jgi:hypothetical protein